MSGFRRPHQAVDFDALVRRFPPAPEYFESAWLDDPATIEHKQLTRLRERAESAARVPFFARRWERAGFDPADMRSLFDLDRVPAYTVDDIRASIDEDPPFGDYQGVQVGDACREPMRLYMSGGTTGSSDRYCLLIW